MRNIWRVLAFDIVAPLAAIAALLLIGLVLGWPKWWVAVCAALCVLIVQGIAVNFLLARRDRVTVGTDDDGPGLRLAVVGFTTAALIAAVVVAYEWWTLPDRQRSADIDEVVRLSGSVVEDTATFSPQDPMASFDRAAALMSPEQAEAYKSTYGKLAAALAAKNVSAQASTVSAGVEVISPEAASVAVVVRDTQSKPGSQPDRAVLAMRVTLQKKAGKWLVFDVSPVNPSPPPPSSPAAPSPPPQQGHN
jgi:hypothetical protein